MALNKSPYGNKPQNLESVIPGQQPEPQAGGFRMPAQSDDTLMEMEAAGADGADVGDYLDSDGYLEEGEAPATASADAPAASDVGDYLDTGDYFEEGEAPGKEPKQGPPEPTSISILGKYGYFRDPDGNLLFRDPTTGEMRPPTPEQREAAGTLANTVKLLPTLLASMAGGGAGALMGPAAQVLGGATGAVAGGEAAHNIDAVSELEEVAYGHKVDRTWTQRLLEFLGGAAGEALALPATAKFGEKQLSSAVAKEAEKQAAQKPVNEAAKLGAEALQAQSQAETGGLKAAGLPDVPAHAMRSENVKKGVLEQLKGKFDEIREAFPASPKATARDYLQNFESNNEKTIKVLTDKLKESARQRRFDIPELEAELQAALRSQGYLDEAGNLVADAPGSDPLVRFYKEYKARTSAPVSEEGLGATGGQVPGQTEAIPPQSLGLEDEAFKAKHVQQGVKVGPEKVQPGGPVPVKGGKEPQVQIQEKLPVKGAKRVKYGVEGGEQGKLPLKTPDKTKPGSVDPKDTSYPAKQVQQSFDLQTKGQPAEAHFNSGPNRYLSPRPAGEASRGLTVKELDEVLQRIRSQANFDGGKLRTPSERAFGRLYRAARVSRDEMAAKLFEEQGQPAMAKSLRGARDEYSSKVESVRDFAQMVADNPDKAFKLLIKKDAPEVVKQLAQILPRDSMANLRRQLLDDVAEKVGAGDIKAVEKELNSYGESTLKELFGDALPPIRVFLNGAKVIESRAASEAAKASSWKKVLSFLTKSRRQLIGEQLIRLIEQNPKIGLSWRQRMLQSLQDEGLESGQPVTPGTGRLNRSTNKVMGNPRVLPNAGGVESGGSQMQKTEPKEGSGRGPASERVVGQGEAELELKGPDGKVTKKKVPVTTSKGAPKMQNPKRFARVQAQLASENSFILAEQAYRLKRAGRPLAPSDERYLRQYMKYLQILREVQ